MALRHCTPWILLSLPLISMAQFHGGALYSGMNVTSFLMDGKRRVSKRSFDLMDTDQDTFLSNDVSEMRSSCHHPLWS